MFGHLACEPPKAVKSRELQLPPALLGLAGKETLSSGHEAVYKIGAPNQLGQLAQIIVAWPRQCLRV